METFPVELPERFNNARNAMKGRILRLSAVIAALFVTLAVRTVLLWYQYRILLTGVLRSVRGPETSTKIICPIGQGATGIVFLAHQKINNLWTFVAIKTIPLESMRLHTDELFKVFRTVQKLSDRCPFILKILHGEYILLPYERIMLSTEHCEGGSLRDIAVKGQMNYLRLYDYAVQVLRALEFMHHNNIVHRDVKGENVMLTRKGCVKLGDFDFCKILTTTNSTACGVSGGMGTPEFMAPEVIQGKAGEFHVGRKADVWSFGCMVVELISNGRIRHFRRQNGTVIETRSARPEDLLWGIANGAVPEVCFGNTVMRFSYYSGLLELCWRAVSTGAHSTGEKTRPSASDLLEFATYKVTKNMSGDGFPNVIGFNNAPMMLLQMWVRDRILDIRQDIYLLDPVELESCQEILQNSLLNFRKGPRNAYGVAHDESDKQPSQKQYQCTLNLLLVGRREIFPTGESAVSVRSPDEYSTWCHYVSARCVLTETDPLSPEDIINFVNSHMEFEPPHALPAATCTVGITPADQPSEYSIQIQAILRASYKKHEGTMQKLHKICCTKYDVQ